MAQRKHKSTRLWGKRSRKFGKGLVLGTVVAVAFVAAWEGGKHKDGSSTVYADRLAQGLPTVCGGLTPRITKTPIIVGEVWPAEKCEAEERKAFMKVQSRLELCFKYRPPQSVFDAASSHAWNFGVGATCGSQAMKAWNERQWRKGCRRMARSDSGRYVWSYVKTGRTKANGKPEYKFVRGLANRRAAEVRLCLRDI